MEVAYPASTYFIIKGSRIIREPFILIIKQ